MDDKRYRGVYGCFVDGQLIYVGSSACKLETLQNNHRNWKEKYGEQGRTFFRTMLTEDVNIKDNNTFRWLLAPALRTQQEVETLEGQLIRSLQPKLNIDKDPVASSIKYGRYNDVVSET